MTDTPHPHAKHNRCEATTTTGDRCKRAALPGGCYCHAHDPERKDALREAGRKGGAVPRRPELPDADALTPEKARRVLAAVLAQLLAGEISEGVARSVGYLLATDAKLRETGEMEERLGELESIMEGRNEHPKPYRAA